MRQFFYCMLVGTLFVSTIGWSETWRITSLEWPPYSGEQLEGGGTAVQELRDLLAQKNIELAVDFVPWARAQEYAASEKYIGYFPAWPEEVQKGFVASKNVQFSVVGLLYHGNQAPEWGSMVDLFERYNVGLIRTYVYPAAIEAAAKLYPYHVALAPHEISLLRMLDAGRMDVAITDPAVMLYYARQESLTHVRASPRIIERKPLVLAFHARPSNLMRVEMLNALIEHKKGAQ